MTDFFLLVILRTRFAASPRPIHTIHTYNLSSRVRSPAVADYADDGILGHFPRWVAATGSGQRAVGRK